MKKTLLTLLALAALLPGLVFAQSKTTPQKADAKLVFYDDDTQLIITDDKGNDVTPNEGLSLAPGWVIKTQKTTAEIKLNPNGTILKLTNNTTFQIKNLRETGATTGSNDFALLQGKIRAVAAKLTGTSKAPGYNLSTPTANCGVRGTDFAMEYLPDSNMDWVCVQDGQVDFTNITTGATVPVASGQFANTFDTVFQSTAVSADRLKQLFSDLDFQKLNPADVTGHETPAAAQEKPADTAPAAQAAPTPAPAGPEDPMLTFLKKLFGLEIGTVTIDGVTYSKAVLSPVLTLDNFKLALYLPAVYSSDLFDAGNWYHPRGNNEWSFGSDKSFGNDYVARLKDFGTDLALKIRYLEWGNPGFDPAYLKLGNLETMTLSHGSVMLNFANDQEFPSVRKIGVNAGAHLNAFGVEAVVDDLSDPQIYGGTLAFDLVKDQFILGVSAVADTALVTPDTLSDPQFAGKTAAQLGDPVLLVGGLSLQIFKLDLGAVKTIGFVDVNTLTAYYRDSYTANAKTVDQGFAYQTIWDGSSPKSYGGEAGIYGSVLIMDYRLAYQVEKGLYTNTIFQANYYQSRASRVAELNSYLTNPAYATVVDGTLNMGIFGDAAFNILNIVTFEAGYRWPFALDSKGTIRSADASHPDDLLLKLTLLKDKLPIVKLSGSVSYERVGFVTSLQNKVSLFDGNTVLSGEVVYGLVPSLDLVLGVSSNIVRDANGNVVYENGVMKVAPSIDLETRISF